MTDKQKTTQEESSAPFKDMPFAAMMKQMMGQQGCNCATQSVMTQMMAMCGATQAPGETQTSAQETKEAENG